MAVERKSGEATEQERGPSSAEEARELLAQRLVWKMETFDPGLEERSWFDLCDAERALYRHSITAIDRDRGTPRGAAPPTPPGIRVAYHGGSIGLSRCRNIELGETE
jgi:hypothetical protein